MRRRKGSYVLATDIADYLVDKGMPFREAHGVVARLSQYAVERMACSSSSLAWKSIKALL